MVNRLIQKLENFTRLSRDDKAALDALIASRVRRYGARDDLVSEGEPPRDIYLVNAGWAYRYKSLEDGRRQILAFFLPGDICDINIAMLRAMDHSIAALTPLSVAEVSPRALEGATAGRPRLLQALHWEALVNIAVQREWTVNLGQRTATERIAHLLIEIYERLRAVGLAEGDVCALPTTQTDLADATGLTAVHVNRTLQDLRARGLIALKGGILTLPDREALKRVALFNDNYLHLGREGSHLDAND